MFLQPGQLLVEVDVSSLRPYCAHSPCSVLWAAVAPETLLPAQVLQLSTKSLLQYPKGFPGGASGKEFTCQCRRRRRYEFDPWVGKIPWRRKQQPIPVFLPGKSQTPEPRGLQSMGPQRVGHDWARDTLTFSTLKGRVLASSVGVTPQWLLYHSASQSHVFPTRSRFQPWGGSGALPWVLHLGPRNSGYYICC